KCCPASRAQPVREILVCRRNLKLAAGFLVTMKTWMALFLLLPALLLAQSNGSRQPAPLVLAHVTVIDVAGGPSKPDMTVVIRGDRISDIGKAGEILPPTDATVVDASGKFLIPGL